MISFNKPTKSEEEVDIDEKVLFGDITAEVEQLVEVEAVPEHAAELRKELDNIKDWLAISEHKAIIVEIDEHLVETSSISKHDASLESQMQDVQQQLKSQEQQFLSIDGRFDQLATKIDSLLTIKQPSTQPSEDSSLKSMIE